MGGTRDDLKQADLAAEAAYRAQMDRTSPYASSTSPSMDKLRKLESAWHRTRQALIAAQLATKPATTGKDGK